MSTADFLTSLGQVLLDAFAPLRSAVKTPTELGALLRREGWRPPPDGGYFAKLSSALALAGDIEKVADALGQIAGGGLSLTDVQTALDAAAKLLRDLAALARPADPQLPAPLDRDDFWKSFPDDLVQDLVISYFEKAHPVLFAPLHLLGVFDEQTILPAAGDNGRLPYQQRRVRWDRLLTIVSAPESLPRDVYGWGGTFDHGKLLLRIDAVLRALGVLSGRQVPAGELVRHYFPGDLPPDLRLLRATLLRERNKSGGVEVGVAVLPIPPAAAGAPNGLFIGPTVEGTAGTDIPLAGPITLQLGGGLESTGLVGVEIRPGKISARLDAAAATLALTIALKAQPAQPWRLIGDDDSTRLELGDFAIGLELAGAADDPELKLRLHTGGLRLVIDPSEGDEFLQDIFGSDPQTLQASGDLIWSSKTGLHFDGTATLQLTIPLNVSFGPARLSQFIVGVAPQDSGVATSFGISGGGTLGPIAVSVQNLGVKLILLPVQAPARGTFGDLDLQFAFKPPSGAGLAIDVAGLTGGGFLSHDATKGEYAGVLQLQYIDLALQAFGLITTQVAGGSGYSLLALVDAEFPPVQLGWGFTLNGVGGLLAMHRTASTDALHAALKAGQLSSILFPKSAIANAPAILGQLDTLFPTAPGRFLFGPMALIGWGTPQVLSAAIAVIVELPEPVRVILLSRIEARLPDSSNALVRINMDALGILDLGQDDLSFDAELFDSKLVGYTLSGAMALRATWAGQREFVLAIGGVHPQFTPPAGFPTLQPVTIDMSAGSAAKLRLAAYLALTSNSIQFGAKLDVMIGVSGFGLSGHLGFDALLQRDPFRFSADISGSVAITAGGDDIASVSLDATLSGPAPYHIAGTFKVHVIFFDVHYSFDDSWGDDAPALPQPSADVDGMLRAALALRDGWEAPLPDGLSPLVSVRSLTDTTTLAAHPLAQPGVHESIVPLGIAITRFGEAVPAGATTFTITALRLGGSAVGTETIEDDFAPAQFFDLTDEEKLEGPSYERHDAGVRMTGAPVTTGVPTFTSPIYETFYIDTPGQTPRDDSGIVAPPPGHGDLPTLMWFGAVGRAAVVRSARRYQAPGNPIRVAEPAFVLADPTTLAPATVGPAAGATFSQMRALLAQHPNLQIIATHEMTAN